MLFGKIREPAGKLAHGLESTVPLFGEFIRIHVSAQRPSHNLRDAMARVFGFLLQLFVGDLIKLYL